MRGGRLPGWSFKRGTTVLSHPNNFLAALEGYSTVKINLVDAPRALIGDLSEQSLPFDLHHRGISMDDDFVVLRVLSDKI